MTFLFRQTRTQVHSAAAQRRERLRGRDSAARASAAVQLGLQLLLWIIFYAYDRTVQTTWQAVLLLIAPLGVLWLLWRKAATDHPAAKWWMLPLWLCLLLDASLATAAISGFIAQLVPTYPPWVSAVIPSTVCWLAALCARPRGVRYGSAVLAVPLIILLVFGTVFLRASSRGDHLWPFLGDGLSSTAYTALGGAGAVWGVALLFWNPRRDLPLKTAGWALVPWVLCVIWALWCCFIRPWTSGDSIPVAEKMMGLARHANSVILYEMSGVMWMLLIPSALIGCFSSAGQLIRRALPRVPDFAALLPVPVIASALVLIWPQDIFRLLGYALPWRYVLCLLCAAGLFWLKRKEKRA